MAIYPCLDTDYPLAGSECNVRPRTGDVRDCSGVKQIFSPVAKRSKEEILTCVFMVKHGNHLRGRGKAADAANIQIEREDGTTVRWNIQSVLWRH